MLQFVATPHTVTWMLLTVLAVVGFLLCHTSLNSNQASLELWKMALRSGFYITLIRDEVLNIHKVSEDHFDNIKGYATTLQCTLSTLWKKVDDLKHKDQEDRQSAVLLKKDNCFKNVLCLKPSLHHCPQSWTLVLSLWLLINCGSKEVSL